jgi:hypothetical protein
MTGTEFAVWRGLQAVDGSSTAFDVPSYLRDAFVDFRTL